MSHAKALIMKQEDNVATLLQDTSAYTVVSLLCKGKAIDTVEIFEDIEMFHKIALVDLEKGQQVRKYGEVIGVTTEGIKLGEYVHTHNVRSAKV